MSGKPFKVSADAITEPEPGLLDVKNLGIWAAHLDEYDIPRLFSQPPVGAAALLKGMRPIWREAYDNGYDQLRISYKRDTTTQITKEGKRAYPGHGKKRIVTYYFKKMFGPRPEEPPAAAPEAEPGGCPTCEATAPNAPAQEAPTAPWPPPEEPFTDGGNPPGPAKTEALAWTRELMRTVSRNALRKVTRSVVVNRRTGKVYQATAREADRTEIAPQLRAQMPTHAQGRRSACATTAFPRSIARSSRPPTARSSTIPPRRSRISTCSPTRSPRDPFIAAPTVSSPRRRHHGVERRAQVAGIAADARGGIGPQAAHEASPFRALSARSLELLGAAGWNEERWVPLEAIRAALEREGQSLHDPAAEFLERFGGLRVTFQQAGPNGATVTKGFHFDAAAAAPKWTRATSRTTPRR